MSIHTSHLLFAFCALVLASVGLDARAQEPERPNTMPALPTLEEVPSFDRIRVEEGGSTQTVIATRKRDGAQLEISAWVLPSEREAREMMPQMITVTRGREGRGHQVEVGPGGRVVGQEMRCPNNKVAAPFPAPYQFAVRDGRSVLFLRFDFPFLKDKNGKNIEDEHGDLVKPLVPPEDLTLIEDQALLCLSKLTKMGYTSKSTPPKR